MQKYFMHGEMWWREEESPTQFGLQVFIQIQIYLNSNLDQPIFSTKRIKWKYGKDFWVLEKLYKNISHMKNKRVQRKEVQEI